MALDVFDIFCFAEYFDVSRSKHFLFKLSLINLMNKFIYFHDKSEAEK